MKKFTVLFLALFLLASPLVCAPSNNTYSVTEGTSLKITLVSQDPYPAEPGGYVDLLFKVENDGNKKADDVVFELIPEYPFSLDPGVDASKNLGTIAGQQTDENAYLLKYKVRVDDNAIDGTNEIEVSYSYGSGSMVYTVPFDVDIANPKTDFDVVMQDYSSGTATLAIANIGENTAYSLIIRVPDQQNYATTGASANVVGNLDAGDYTLVSFQVSSKSAGFNATGTIPVGSGQRNFTQGDNFTQRGNFTGADLRNNLTVEISYTDELGIRRTVQKNVLIDTAGATSFATRTSGSSSLTDSSVNVGADLMYIIVGVVGIAAVIVIIRIWHRKRKPKKTN